MSRTRPYPPEYRQQILELARAGRSAYELAQEFEPSYWTIHQWIKQADRDAGQTAEGLSTKEREDLRRLALATPPAVVPLVDDAITILAHAETSSRL